LPRARCGKREAAGGVSAFGVRNGARPGAKPKKIGGGMVGPQNTSIRAQLGPLLNCFTNYDFWLPVPKMLFPGVEQLSKK